jgi:hypothetical protein
MRWDRSEDGIVTMRLSGDSNRRQSKVNEKRVGKERNIANSMGDRGIIFLRGLQVDVAAFEKVGIDGKSASDRTAWRLQLHDPGGFPAAAPENEGNKEERG